jgi:hypothetical protein
MERILKKSLDISPDETQTFDRGKTDLAKFGEITIGVKTWVVGNEPVVGIDFHPEENTRTEATSNFHDNVSKTV